MPLKKQRPVGRGEFGAAQMLCLGHALRELREARSWSLKRIAAESGLSVAAVQKVEAGQVNPSLLTILSLAEALGEPVDRLIENSRAASLAMHVTRGHLPDTGAELSSAGTHPRMGARLLVVPARRAAEDLPAEGPGLFFVLDGRVRITFGDGAAETLDTGDALHVAAGLAQRCTNLLARRSRILYLADRREAVERSKDAA